MGQAKEHTKGRKEVFTIFFGGEKTTLPKHRDSHTEGSKVYVPLSMK
jgi:tRNA(Leu) C34 or U34 (ribose-2'-O)-methylase TrmL